MFGGILEKNDEEIQNLQDSKSLQRRKNSWFLRADIWILPFNTVWMCLVEMSSVSVFTFLWCTNKNSFASLRMIILFILTVKSDSKYHCCICLEGFWRKMTKRFRIFKTLSHFKGGRILGFWEQTFGFYLSTLSECVWSRWVPFQFSLSCGVLTKILSRL